MKRKRNEFTLNVGTSSILFIFIILCLVSFATLSLSSAMSDYRLSSRVFSNSMAYHDACNAAEGLLASFDDTLSDLYASGISRSGYFDKVGHKKSFAIPVTDIQSLIIEIEIVYPDAEGEAFYTIEKWKLETTQNLEYDSSLPVFK